MYNTTEIYIVPTDTSSNEVEFTFWVEEVSTRNNKGKYDIITYVVSGGGIPFVIVASLLYLGAFEVMK